ncbi:MAG: GNAT family N-acetyltransferase [Clostridia bacterium]|nr:GNAT family N-acetyltransferase [Clostridia bacterium]
MQIMRANTSHINGLNELLEQVLNIHHEGRPDLFKGDTKKYTNEELVDIINDDNKPIFVAVDDTGIVIGYAFCMFIQHKDNNILTDVKTLYIDDLCVREGLRGQHIGKNLYNFVLNFAKSEACYNVTLNVWALNTSAKAFYDSLGMKPQKYGMETIL